MTTARRPAQIHYAAVYVPGREGVIFRVRTTTKRKRDQAVAEWATQHLEYDPHFHSLEGLIEAGAYDGEESWELRRHSAPPPPGPPPWPWPPMCEPLVDLFPDDDEEATR